LLTCAGAGQFRVPVGTLPVNQQPACHGPA